MAENPFAELRSLTALVAKSNRGLKTFGGGLDAMSAQLLGVTGLLAGFASGLSKLLQSAAVTAGGAAKAGAGEAAGSSALTITRMIPPVLAAVAIAWSAYHIFSAWKGDWGGDATRAKVRGDMVKNLEGGGLINRTRSQVAFSPFAIERMTSGTEIGSPTKFLDRIAKATEDTAGSVRDLGRFR